MAGFRFGLLSKRILCNTQPKRPVFPAGFQQIDDEVTSFETAGLRNVCDDFGVQRFFQVTAAQSLSKVARERQVAASHVSRHFARIEAQCRLLLAHRTTHSLSLMGDGEVFLEIARRIGQEHTHLQGSMGARSQAVNGTVRISISQLFA